MAEFRTHDIYFVDPDAVEIENEGRQLPDEGEITEMAISFATLGQRRPVECIRTGGRQLVLVHGVIRTLAARLLRTGFQSPATGKVKDRRFRLKVALVSQEGARE